MKASLVFFNRRFAFWAQPNVFAEVQNLVEFFVFSEHETPLCSTHLQEKQINFSHSGHENDFEEPFLPEIMPLQSGSGQKMRCSS